MDELPPELALHYRVANEDERLRDGSGRLEFLRTWELLERFLPPPPAVVLDVGGATGVYAFPLAREGYEVHLVDALDHHIEVARERAASTGGALPRSIEVGDARRLDAADGAADALLLLGPLYHLIEWADRRAALDEARRVLRPGGILIAAAISRFASTIDGIWRGFVQDEAFDAMVEGVLDDGVHRNNDPEGQPEWFTTSYFHLPDELADEIEGAGFDLRGVFAVEGPAWKLPDLSERLEDEGGRERIMSAIRRVEQQPSLAGASAHLLAIASAPGGASG